MPRLRTLFVSFSVIFSILLQAVPMAAAQGAPMVSSRAKRLLLNSGISPESIEQGYVEGEVIVKFQRTRSFSARAVQRSVLATQKLEVVEELGEIDAQVVQSQVGKDVEEIIENLENDPDVEYVQPNYIYYPLVSSPNDSYFGQLWALNNLGQNVNGMTGTHDADTDALEAWDIEGDSQVAVGVIDSGVDLDHPDFQANLVSGYDFGDYDNTPEDDLGHGTHVAGIIAARANNSRGSTGVSYKNKVKVVPLRFGFTTGSAVEAINYAKNKAIKILNASWGGEVYDSALYSAIADYPGIFVAAAGNSGSNHSSSYHLYPADFDLANIITVAATDNRDQLATFAGGQGSDYGVSSVDVGAPGKNILSTYLSGNYAYMSGTSMAAPHVAGLAALIWSKDSGLSRAEVKSIILTTGDAIPALSGITVSGKRINMRSALEAVSGTSIPGKASILSVYHTTTEDADALSVIAGTINNPDDYSYQICLQKDDQTPDASGSKCTGISTWLTKNDGGFVPADTFDRVNGVLYQTTGLVPNTRYYAFVRAKDAVGNIGAWSDSKDEVTLAEPVTGFQAVASHYTEYYGNQIDVSWQLGNATHVEIFRNTEDKTCGDTGTNVFSGNTEGVAETNLNANTNYYYRIFSYNQENAQNTQCVKASAVTAPGAVENLLVSETTSSSILWQWDAVSGAESYNIYIDEGASAVSVDTLSYTLNNITANSVHSLRVAAVANALQGPKSASISGTAGAVTSLDVIHTANTDDSITWSWQSAGGYVSYLASMDGQESGWMDAGIDSWTTENLNANTQYTLQLKAKDGNDVETNSVSALAYTSIEVPVPAVHEITSSSIIVELNNTLSNLQSDNSAVYYSIQNGGQNSGWIKDTNWEATGLQGDSIYPIIAQARNGDGDETPKSSAIEVRTLANVPYLSVDQASTSGIMLIVHTNNNSSDTKYYLERATDENFTQDSFVVADWIHYENKEVVSDVALAEGMTYYYRIKAINSDSVSPVETEWSSVMESSTSARPSAGNVAEIHGHNNETVYSGDTAFTFKNNNSGVSRYHYSWDTSESYTPSETSPAWNIGYRLNIGTPPAGGEYYLHLLAINEKGRVAAVFHKGPYKYSVETGDEESEGKNADEDSDEEDADSDEEDADSDEEDADSEGEDDDVSESAVVEKPVVEKVRYIQPPVRQPVIAPVPKMKPVYGGYYSGGRRARSYEGWKDSFKGFGLRSYVFRP